jgi:hypothetical protein
MKAASREVFKKRGLPNFVIDFMVPPRNEPV